MTLYCQWSEKQFILYRLLVNRALSLLRRKSFKGDFLTFFRGTYKEGMLAVLAEVPFGEGKHICGYHSNAEETN